MRGIVILGFCTCFKTFGSARTLKSLIQASCLLIPSEKGFILLPPSLADGHYNRSCLFYAQGFTREELGRLFSLMRFAAGMDGGVSGRSLAVGWCVNTDWFATASRHRRMATGRVPLSVRGDGKQEIQHRMGRQGEFQLGNQVRKATPPGACQRRISPITVASVKVGNCCRNDSKTLVMIVCRRAPANVLLVRPVLRSGGAAQRSFGFVVRAGDRPGFTVRCGNRRGGDEEEQLLGQHQPHQFVAEQPVVVGRSFERRQIGALHRPAEFENLVVQFGDPPLAACVAESPVGLHAARRVVNLQQPIRQPAVRGVVRFQERQLDRLLHRQPAGQSETVCPRGS